MNLESHEDVWSNRNFKIRTSLSPSTDLTSIWGITEWTFLFILQHLTEHDITNHQSLWTIKVLWSMRFFAFITQPICHLMMLYKLFFFRSFFFQCRSVGHITGLYYTATSLPPLSERRSISLQPSSIPFTRLWNIPGKFPTLFLALLAIKISIEGNGLYTSVYYKCIDSHSSLLYSSSHSSHVKNFIPFHSLSYFVAYIVKTLVFPRNQGQCASFSITWLSCFCRFIHSHISPLKQNQKKHYACISIPTTVEYVRACKSILLRDNQFTLRRVLVNLSKLHAWTRECPLLASKKNCEISS